DPQTPASDRVVLRHNLPLQLTSFVGRERELTELPPLLATTRLLTVTGPGGIGKTRLAQEVAGGMLDRYGDGVWFVELAPLADETQVPQAVAASLAVRIEAPSTRSIQQLAGALRGRHLLLLLDNCEHVLAACAALSEALLR